MIHSHSATTTTDSHSSSATATPAMRATFSSSHSRHSTPTSPSRELDALTPRQHVLPLADLKPSTSLEHSGPVIYDTALRRGQSSSSSEGPHRAAALSLSSPRTFGSTMHDLYSPNALFDDHLQASGDFFDRVPAHELQHSGAADTTAGEPAEPCATQTMNTSDSSGKPPSRGRSYSNTSRRGHPGRPPQRQPPSHSFGPPVGYPTLQDQPQGFHGQYPQANPPYGQRAPFVAGHAQYTMAPAPSMVHHQPGGTQYAYPNHPGLHAPDTTMHPQNQLMGYSTNTLVPMMQHYFAAPSPPEAPPGSSSTGVNHSHPVTSAGTTPTLYTPAHPSPPSSQGLTPSYSTQSPYAARFSTPPYVYSPVSFTQPGSALYQSPFSYEQQYRPAVSVSAESDSSRGQGTWWYLPPGTRPAPSPHYDAYAPQPYQMYSPIQAHDVDSYGQTQHGSSSRHYPTLSPRLPPTLQSFPPPHPPPPLLQHSPSSDQPPPPSAHMNPLSRSVSEPARSEAASSPSVLSRTTGSGRHIPGALGSTAARRAYHPNPPANRSEWVMWAGNVPSDATHDELWRFFNRSSSPGGSSASSSGSAPPPAGSSSVPSPAESAAGTLYGGVSSIFLISRSNCAFVNYVSEACLHAAIARFNGHPLRPHDPRCPRLVCRVRAREDDLKAGVGGQRGSGIHLKWIKEQRAKAKQQARAASAGKSPEASSSELSMATTPSSEPGDTASVMMRSLSLSSTDDGGPDGTTRRRTKKPSGHSNSSESYASTNSSLFAQYFPKRYFILKSLSQFDLDLSVEQGVWATQKHNEGVLDKAYRTSKDVYLIFGVNKTGEFYGYARMAGPIFKGHGESGSDRRVSWASRSSIDSPPARRSTTGGPSSPVTSRKSAVPYFSPSEGTRYEDSPLPMEEPKEGIVLPRPKIDLHSISAPAVMGDKHNPLSAMSTGPRYGERSYDPILPPVPSMLRHSQPVPEDFHLDPEAPDRAIKQRSADEAQMDSTGVKRWDAVPRRSGTSSLGSVKEEEEDPRAPGLSSDKGKEKGREGGEAQADGVQSKEDRQVWGESFQVEWLKTTRLPFYRTRQLRNPWNHDREVKVSRDGTELEPSVGQALLDEWDKPEPSPPSQQPPRSGTKSSPPDIAQEGADGSG